VEEAGQVMNATLALTERVGLRGSDLVRWLSGHLHVSDSLGAGDGAAKNQAGDGMRAGQVRNAKRASPCGFLGMLLAFPCRWHAPAGRAMQAGCAGSQAGC